MDNLRVSLRIGILSLLLTLTGWGQEVVPPEVRLKSYTQNYSYGGGYSYSGNWYGSAYSGSYGWNGWHNINWNSATGGTERYGGSYSGNWTYTDWGSWIYGYYYDVLTTWPAPPALGTMVYTNSWNWTYPDGLGGTATNADGGSETYPDIAQPGGFPWRYAQVYKYDSYSSGDQDPDGQWWWTNSWGNSLVDSTRTHIDLHTGGATNSTAQSLFVLTVSAYDAETWETVDPTLIQIRGEFADTNGVVALTLNDNGIYDVTPTLPAAYSNYYFYASNPNAVRPFIIMDFDQELIDIQSNNWLYFTNDSLAAVPFYAARAAAAPPVTVPQIWTNGPNNVTVREVTKVIGQRVTYRIGNMEGSPDAQYLWKIPASAVSGWSEIPIVISGSYTNAAGYTKGVVITNNELAFFCTEEIVNQRIECQITVAGTQLPVLRTFLTVRRPDVTFTAKREGIVEVSTNHARLLGVPALHFGRGTDNNTPGIRFEYQFLSKPAVPAPFSLMLLQIGESEIIENFPDSSSRISKSTGRDGNNSPPWFFIFGSATKDNTGDSPADGLQYERVRNSFQRWDKFTTYLMFQSGGLGASDSVPVPLKMIKWKWMGAGTNSVPSNPDTWLKSTGTPLPSISSSITVPFTEFPGWLWDIWDQNSTNGTSLVTNSFPKPLPDLGGY